MGEGGSLHVAVSTQRRGAEVFAVDLAAELRRRGEPADVVALVDVAGATLPLEVLGRRAFDPRTLLALRRVARGRAAVVAHGSRTLPACAAALAGAVPFAYRSIGDPAAWSADGWRRARTAGLLARAATVVVLWPGAADVVIARHRVPAGRVRVVPNGVPAARCPVPDDGARVAARARFGLPADAPVVAYVGSLTAEKQVGAAIAAVAMVDGARLLVAGDGPLRSTLEAEAARSLPGRVHFAGVVTDSAPVYAACDAVVLTSRTEGMPGVLIEAGLCGRPAVASDVGAVAEVVADGETGVLVAAGDADATARALRRVLADPAPLGAAARARCLERFEIGVVGTQWATVLADLGAIRRTP